MSAARDLQADCPADEAIQMLQEKWTLQIIRALLPGPRGFNELGREIGCNSATLAQRLERLTSLGILSKTVQSVMPPRTSYALTPAGCALQDVILEIDRWARTYLPGTRQPADAGTAPSRAPGEG